MATSGEDARAEHESSVEPWPPAIRYSITILLLFGFGMAQEAPIRAKNFANLADKVVATVDVPGGNVLMLSPPQEAGEEIIPILLPYWQILF